ncbi:MAG: dihydropteroate synthase [Verrucomicrobiales bacterium]|nr:dihydropteroate synthase [Verrucomicrobiales bacterium]
MNTKIWKCRDFTFDPAVRGEIMGILNVTPDSFSDGGKFSTLDAAVAQAGNLIEEGAAILDIGGESTRPGAADVSVEEELKRTQPVIQELVRQFPGICLSIDTSKPEVASDAMETGAHVINDVTGFRNAEMIRVAADTGAGAVVMHMQGSPETMQQSPGYENVVHDVKTFFETQLERMLASGVASDAIVFDPGIGFGKTLQHNLELLHRIEELETGNRPLLLGVSRKSFIGKLIQSDTMEERSWPTVGITAYTAEKGVRLHRVHEVRPNLESLRMIEAILQSI